MCSLPTVCFSSYVPSHLHPLTYTHTCTCTHATHVPVLSCCVVFCLHLVCLLNVYHPCHTYHCSWSSLYITRTTVPVVHVTFVHTYHATCPLCSPRDICYIYFYTYMLHTYIHVHLLSVVCYIPKNKNELLGASVSQVFRMHMVKHCYARQVLR